MKQQHSQHVLKKQVQRHSHHHRRHSRLHSQPLLPAHHRQRGTIDFRYKTQQDRRQEFKLFYNRL